MRSVRMSPVRSASDMPCLPAPPPTATWSQRTWPRSDILVQGQGMSLDSSHNKAAPRSSSSVSANSRLVGGGGAGSGAGIVGGNPLRSYLQTKVGSKMLKDKLTDPQADTDPRQETRSQSNQNSSLEDGGPQKQQQKSAFGLGGWAWEAEASNPILDQFVEKADAELYDQCRQHLDAISQVAQLQQAISDEMRAQAELDEMICESMKARTQRLEKQTGISTGNTEQAWVNTAFGDLRKCVTDQAHVHHVYSMTLNNQSTAIQQSLDSHKDLMERSKQENPSPDTAPGADNRVPSFSAAGMSFVQATCVFEGVRRPRLKLLSELDFLTIQVKSLDQQLEDVDSLLTSLAESEDADQGQWRLQLRMEEGRTRQDFLSSRRDQLEAELRKAAGELKTFHIRHRDKMLEVVNVFRQHRLRCDSTLKKSLSLLRAASQADPDVLHTLDARKENWLSPVPEPPAATEAAPPVMLDPWGVETTMGSVLRERPSSASLRERSSSSSLLKRQSEQDRNPLKSRKVYFGGTHYSDSSKKEEEEEEENARNKTNAGDNDASSNRIPAGEEGSRIGEDCEIRGGRFSPSKLGAEDVGKEKMLGEDDGYQSSRKPGEKEGYSWRGSFSPIISPSRYSLASSGKGTSVDTRVYSTARRNSERDASSSGSPAKDILDRGDNEMVREKRSSKEAESSEKTGRSGRHGKSNDKGTRIYLSVKPNPNAADGKPDVTNTEHSGDTSSVRSKPEPHSPLRDNLEALSMHIHRDDSHASDHSPVKSKSSKTDTNEPSDSYRSASPCTKSQTRSRSPRTSIVLSTKPQRTLSPIKAPVQEESKSCQTRASPRSSPLKGEKDTTGKSGHTDQSSAASEDTSSSSDSESSAQEKRNTGLNRDRKGTEATGQKISKPTSLPSLSGGDFAGQADSTNVRPAQGKAQPATDKTASRHVRSGETIASCDTGRRRVAFSDLDTSSRRSDGRHTPSGGAGAAFTSSTTATHCSDRGILKKKPLDSNRQVKTALVREDKILYGRVRSDERSQSSSTTSKSHSAAVHPRRGGTYEKAGPDVKPSSVSAETKVHARDAFIPELTTDDTQSDSSSTSPDDTSQDEKEAVRRAQEEDKLVNQLLKEKKQMDEEEDKINRLISKYANNRRGIGSLSKNFNNSETTVPFEKLGSASVNGCTEIGTEEIGQADRLEFDSENRFDVDGMRKCGSGLGVGSRQVKVCAVRPIPTDPEDTQQSKKAVRHNGHNVTANRREDTPSPSHKMQNNPQIVARLKQFEITAGQFVVRPNQDGVTAAEHVQNHRRTSEDETSAGESDMRGHPREECKWSAQRYSDNLEDINNNLSSEVSTKQHPHARQTGESLEKVRPSAAVNLRSLDSTADKKGNVISSSTSASPVKHRSSSETNSVVHCQYGNRPTQEEHDANSSTEQAILSSPLPQPPSQPCKLESVDATDTFSSWSQSGESQEHQNTYASRLHRTHSACPRQNQPHPVALSTPHCLEDKTFMDSTGSQIVTVGPSERPLKSCLKRRRDDDVRCRSSEIACGWRGQSPSTMCTVDERRCGDLLVPPASRPGGDDPKGEANRTDQGRRDSSGCGGDHVTQKTAHRFAKRVQFRETIHYSDAQESFSRVLQLEVDMGTGVLDNG